MVEVKYSIIRFHISEQNVKIETKYNIGDEFFLVREARENVSIPCSACRTGKIRLLDSIEYMCPKCSGKCTTTIPGKSVFNIIRIMVRGIEVRHVVSANTPEFELPDTVSTAITYIFWRSGDPYTSAKWTEMNINSALNNSNLAARLFTSHSAAQTAINAQDVMQFVGMP